MAKKDYKNYKLISFICIIGALVGVVFAIIDMINGVQAANIERILYSLLGIVFSIVVLFQCLKPDNPIPYHWLLFIIFGILIAIFANLVGGIVVIIGGLVALIDVL